MKRILGNSSERIFPVLRIVAGGLFACHGGQKLFGAFGGKTELNDPLGLAAGIIEFGAGLLIAVGLFTRIAAFLASGEMAVAYFKAHASRAFWPIMNHGELAVLYCFLFLYIAAHGPGRWSLDSVMGKSRR